jgi:hypothetical protein
MGRSRARRVVDSVCGRRSLEAIAVATMLVTTLVGYGRGHAAAGVSPNDTLMYNNVSPELPAAGGQELTVFSTTLGQGDYVISADVGFINRDSPADYYRCQIAVGDVIVAKNGDLPGLQSVGFHLHVRRSGWRRPNPRRGSNRGIAVFARHDERYEPSQPRE